MRKDLLQALKFFLCHQTMRLTCPEAVASKLVETFGWPNFNFIRINMVSGASNYNPTKRCTHHLREPLWRNFLLVEDLKGAITFHRRLENEERERKKKFLKVNQHHLRETKLSQLSPASFSLIAILNSSRSRTSRFCGKNNKMTESGWKNILFSSAEASF